MATNNKSLEDILKELEQLDKDTKEATDAISKLLNEEANANNDILESIIKMKDYTYDNFNGVSPLLALGSAAGPGAVLPLTVATFGYSFLRALIDYGNDYLDQMNHMSELAQSIYDYTADYNENVKVAEEKLKRADDNAEEARNHWIEIQNLVDDNGKLEDPARESDLLDAVKQINGMVSGANIKVDDNQIQNFGKLDNSIVDLINEQSTEIKEFYLKNSYLEALNNINDIEKQCDIAFERLKVINAIYRSKLKEYNDYDSYFNPNKNEDTKDTSQYLLVGEKLVLKSDISYDDYYEAGLAADKAEKMLAEANLQYNALAELRDSYKLVKDEYEKQFLKEDDSNAAKYLTAEEYILPDYGKSYKQLEWESYAEKERAKFLAGRDRLNQTPPANITPPAETPYSTEQPIADTAQNNINAPETEEIVNSLNDAVISQASELPEAMFEIGQQSRDAFIEGLLDGDDEHLGERIAEATLKILNMFSDNMNDLAYQSGSEAALRFMEGFEDNLNVSYESAVTERNLMASGMTAEKQLSSSNYYANVPQPSSRRDEKIVLENKADIKVVLDREVLGKTVMEWTKEYQRRTGT